MYARIVQPEGTDMLFEFVQFSEHAIEDEPGRFMLCFDKGDKVPYNSGYHVESAKDLAVYIMNDNGKTIDSRAYCK